MWLKARLSQYLFWTIQQIERLESSDSHLTHAHYVNSTMSLKLTRHGACGPAATVDRTNWWWC